MTTATAAAPATEILTLLHAYQSLRSRGDDDLKASIWNITRARRGRSYQSSGGFGGVEFSPDDVREELRARALLEWRGGSGSGEPSLVEESSEEEEDDGGSGFVLHLDGMRAATDKQRRRADDEELNNNADIEGNKEKEGLRRRRGGNSKGGDTNDDKWTSEDHAAGPAIDDEEERLRDADPLNLFGVPPPALRVAQERSRGAVAYYVEVANLARGIMEIIHQEAARVEQIEKS